MRNQSQLMTYYRNRFVPKARHPRAYRLTPRHSAVFLLDRAALELREWRAANLAVPMQPPNRRRAKLRRMEEWESIVTRTDSSGLYLCICSIPFELSGSWRCVDGLVVDIASCWDNSHLIYCRHTWFNNRFVHHKSRNDYEFDAVHHSPVRVFWESKPNRWWVTIIRSQHDDCHFSLIPFIYSRSRPSLWHRERGCVDEAYLNQ